MNTPWRVTTGSVHVGSRAVSEVLGFLLVFTVILSVSLGVGVSAIGMFGDHTDTDGSRQGRVALEQVRADQYDLVDGAPFRESSIDLKGGTLRFGEPVTITIEGTSSNGPMEPITVRTLPLVYEEGGSQVVLTTGAIMLTGSGGGVVQSAPRFRIGSDQTILDMINVSGRNRDSVVGGGDARIDSFRRSQSTTGYEPRNGDGPVAGTVRITIATPRTEQWRSFLKSNPRSQNVSVDDESETVSASFETARLFVRVTELSVRIGHE